MTTQQLSPELLSPNDYNPNRMSDTEFAELVTEVRHLGRLPKPLVIRPNGEGFVIIDGEHGWRAAKEVGLSEIPCEVIDVDDFEAMRQTYKRNQHGQHNPVLQGVMFKRMMAESGVSQRELAKDIEVSEGTVRNSLEYVKALESLPEWLGVAKRHIDRHEFEEEDVRNGYALFKAVGHDMHPDDMRNGYALWIEWLSARQVRLLNRLPTIVAGLWFISGADVRALHASKGEPSEWVDSGHGMVAYEDATTCALFELVDGAGEWLRNAEDFLKLRGRVMNKRAELRRYEMGSFSLEELLPYFLRYWNNDFYVRDEGLFEDALCEIIDKSGCPAKLILTPEEWAAVFEEQHKLGGSAVDFKDRLKLKVFEKLGEFPETFEGSLKVEMLSYEIEHNAPDFIKDSNLKRDTDKQSLWKAEGPDFKKQELAKLDELPWDWRRQLETAESDKATAENPGSVATAILDILLAHMQDNGLTLPDEFKKDQIEKLGECDDGVLLAMHDVLFNRYSLRAMFQIATIMG